LGYLSSWYDQSVLTSRPNNEWNVHFHHMHIITACYCVLQKEDNNLLKHSSPSVHLTKQGWWEGVKSPKSQIRDVRCQGHLTFTHSMFAKQLLWKAHFKGGLRGEAIN
jgi:hypothetical protein